MGIEAMDGLPEWNGTFWQETSDLPYLTFYLMHKKHIMQCQVGKVACLFPQLPLRCVSPSIAQWENRKREQKL
ncbi:hypothetical protein KTT_04700 [Tengunoibacter tsumagoiensis]|uniref:Uncharacterized protein n=1 Tax=Tengunoibacter tsumagoiensis TaxID=2014871 RepID=A0A401ZUN8_9CHLR|nr:hypothetical protein KTT_04700 [Tengunoibacter tsumagoiensis]